jgi:hypothetical protein
MHRMCFFVTVSYKSTNNQGLIFKRMICKDIFTAFFCGKV